MQINTKELLAELHQLIHQTTATVRAWRSMPAELLQYRPAEGSWTVLECLEHLNLYGDFYLPEIEKSMLAQQHSPARSTFRPGIIGNYFAGLMKVSEHKKLKKMASPKDKNPIHAQPGITSLDRFLKQQERWTKLLNMAAAADLGKTKTAISLTSLLTLKLGDTFRFCIYHIERHVLQAENVLKQAEIAARA